MIRSTENHRISGSMSDYFDLQVSNRRSTGLFSGYSFQFFVYFDLT